LIGDSAPPPRHQARGAGSRAGGWHARGRLTGNRMWPGRGGKRNGGGTMAEYQRDEARDWAKATMRGGCGCMLPTLNSSLTTVNERAIRHDVRLEKDFGFW